jgi:hypothetical protein
MPNRADCSRFRDEFFTGEFFRSMNELRVLAEAHLSDLSLGNPEISGFPGIYLRRAGNAEAPS